LRLVINNEGIKLKSKLDVNGIKQMGNMTEIKIKLEEI